METDRVLAVNAQNAGVSLLNVCSTTLFDIPKLVQHARSRTQTPPLAYNPFVKLISSMPIISPLPTLVRLPPAPARIPAITSTSDIKIKASCASTPHSCIKGGESEALKRFHSRLGATQEKWILSFSKPKTSAMSI